MDRSVCNPKASNLFDDNPRVNKSGIMGGACSTVTVSGTYASRFVQPGFVSGFKVTSDRGDLNHTRASPASRLDSSRQADLSPPPSPLRLGL